jgi:hypothetical protein
MSRLRLGEWLAAIGAAGLFITLFFDWFAVDWDGVQSQLPAGMRIGQGGLHGVVDVSLGSGWSTLGWLMVALLCVQILGGASLAYMTLKRTAPAWPMGAGILTWTVGGLIWLVLLVRVTIAQPGPDAMVAVQASAYLGLFFALVIPVGGFLSIHDERTHAAEARAYTPPAPRTAPGA